MSRDEAVSEHDLGDAWREFQYTIVNNEITAESFVAFKRSIKRLALKSQLHEREAQRSEIDLLWKVAKFADHLPKCATVLSTRAHHDPPCDCGFFKAWMDLPSGNPAPKESGL